MASSRGVVLFLAIASLAAASVAYASARSQSGTEAEPAFQAISIKLNPHPHLPLIPGSAWSFPQVKSGRWQGASLTLAELVAYAYGLHCCGAAVEAGSPEIGKWIDTTGFAIVATTATETVPDSELRAMVRQMLETRFQLQTHSTSRTLPVYTLEVAPGGAKLRPAVPCDPDGDATDASGAVPRCGLGGGPAGKPGESLGSFRSFTMAELAEWWETSFFVIDRRPIVDQTGLEGKYDFDLLVNITSLVGAASNPDQLHDDVAATMKTLESQDGLRLDVFRTVRMPIAARVVDRAVIPTE